MYTIEQVNEAIQTTPANMVTMRRVLNGMFQNEYIYDYLVHEEDDTIVIYYSLTEDEDTPFFIKVVAKD